MSNQIEEIVNGLIKPYEERMLLDVAAGLFEDYSVNNVIRLKDFLDFLPNVFGFSISAAKKVFQQFDEDESGTIDASEFLQIIRYLNYGSGYCDGCDEPIQQNEEGFLCQTCEGYILCSRCYMTSEKFHPQAHRFAKTTKVKKDDTSGLPPSVGYFLRSHVYILFAGMDKDKSGEITHDEFINYQLQQGYPTEFINFLLNFDLDGDGTISPRELLFLTVGLGTLRACDECGDRVFIGSYPLACCVECVAEYDVCGDCINAGKCSHPHENYHQVSLFDLRHAGLCYQYSGSGAEWNLIFEDKGKWMKFRPFIESELLATASFGPPTAKPHIDHTHITHHTQMASEPAGNQRSHSIGSNIGKMAASAVGKQLLGYVAEESGLTDAIGDILSSLFI